ncbi:M23 family metallopeptidase [Kineococcus auxinigenes]|uniref:M23 family metallopeptidase n=1 Tax=unclassified Kineococcus TaxID=2621656 RepID=UPI003D7E074B
MSPRTPPPLRTTGSAPALPGRVRALARLRGAANRGLCLLVVALVALEVLPGPGVPLALEPLVVPALVVLVVLVVVLTVFGGGPRPPARLIGPVVTGRWQALSTPADRVPSHGTHGYGQTYAVDLLADPADGSRPPFGVGGGLLPPQRFPAFGQPVLAGSGGRVVRASGRARDHRSRNSWLALPFLFLEGALRDLVSWRLVVGNHVVVDHGDGSFACYAHLRRGSLRVRPGDAVRAGDVLGECGNSGNSSEPHLHLQLMDRPSPALAAGIPFAFTGTVLEAAEGGAGQDDGRGVVPGRGQRFSATAAAPR